MKKLIFFIFTLLFIYSLVFAEKIEFSADTMSGKTGSEASETVLEGNAFISTEAMEIRADKIELTGEEYRYIIATGNVKGENNDTNMDFTCNILKFDRVTKIARLEGDVVLLDNDNDVKAEAQIIEYNQESNIAILQIKINLVQEDNICSSAYAIYHKNEQLLELSGNAQVKKNEDTFRAQYITLNMETQDITLGGNVRGLVKDTKTPQQDESSEESNNNQE